MQISTTELLELISILTLIFLIAPFFIMVYVGLYNKRKKRHQQEKEQLQSSFRHELLKSQIEIHEQTLNYVSQEIHDNIGQVLSFVKLTLSTAANFPEAEKQKKIDDSREQIARAITDLRDLSKSLSLQSITSAGLLKTIQSEVDRVEKSGLVSITLYCIGNAYSLGEQRELVLFRILQEAINNSLKHSGAAQLKISLIYSDRLFNLTIEDDGTGFVPADELSKNGGSGLGNIYNRAVLIGAVANISSSPGNGCVISVSLNPFEQQLHIDGNHQNSTG